MIIIVGSVYSAQRLDNLKKALATRDAAAFWEVVQFLASISDFLFNTKVHTRFYDHSFNPVGTSFPEYYFKLIKM